MCEACGVDFENKNYTVLTSQCKGPQYPPKVCCEAFKQFACPFSNEVNDMTTDCATVMFSYINIYGKYPPGLFANQCKEGNQGLDCSQVTPTNTSSNTIHVAAPPHFFSLATISAFLGFLFHLFWKDENVNKLKKKYPLVLIEHSFQDIWGENPVSTLYVKWCSNLYDLIRIAKKSISFTLSLFCFFFSFIDTKCKMWFSALHSKSSLNIFLYKEK